ncbi:MAG: radical SAM protein, partial [Candidatus Bathyarchaeia archaeon]
MSALSPETVWSMTDAELKKVFDKKLFTPQRQRKIIHFYAPSFMYYRTSYYCSSPTDFPTISVTGNSCTLKCKHCEGKVLETMLPAVTPEKLYELCAQLKEQGAKG